MKIVVNPSQIQIPQLSDQELCDLRQARLLLEQPTLAMRMTQHLGRPVERVMEAMPREAPRREARAARKERARRTGATMDGGRCGPNDQ